MATDPVVEVKFEEQKLKAVARLLRGIPNGMNLVIPPAINLTATTARACLARDLKEDVNLKISAIKKRIILHRANKKNWRARLRPSRKGIPLILYGARQTKKGVTYKDVEEQRVLMEGAFIQTMPITGAKQKKGHKGVFERDPDDLFSTGRDTKGRVRKGRLPIKELYGVSLAWSFENIGQIRNKTMAETGEILEKNIDSKVAWLLSRRAS